MGYLYSRDYLLQIQSSLLTQIQTGDNSVLLRSEIAAENEVKSYLQQKYITDDEFTDTTVWSNTVAYSAADRVYLDATAYSASSTYAIGALALQGGNVYRCSTAIVTPEAFNAAKWTLINAQYTLYYVSYPADVFDLYATYAKDDIVFYQDKRYQCLIPSSSLTHSSALQYNSISSLPYQNVFPDDATNGAKYWEDLGAYTVAAGTLPTDDTKWTLGDNRDQNILIKVVDIALYHLHSRIAPQNIPALRQNRYDDALTYLKAAAKGNVTIDMPVIQPKQGQRISYGGQVKRVNSY